MSNHFALVHERRLLPAVDAWIRRNDVPTSERVFINLARRRRLVIISAGAASEALDQQLTVGTLVDTASHAIGFGTPGWMSMRGGRQRSRTLGGEFVRYSWDRSSVTIERDFTGSIALLETGGAGWIAFSDSLLMLADLRIALGERNTANVPVAIARSRTLAICTQQLSPETILSQIRFVPGGHGRSLRLGREIQVDDLDQGVVASQGVSAADHDETLRRAATEMAGMVRAVAYHDGIVPSLGLSGGLDSRVVLAALRVAGVLHLTSVESQYHESDKGADFAIAKGLCAQLGVALNEPGNFKFGRRGSAVESPPLAIWASSSLGVYDRLLPSSGARARPRQLYLSGLGAEMLKGNYGWRNIKQLEHKYCREYIDRSPLADLRRHCLMDQIERGIRAVDADPATVDASEWHYTCYRVGLHGAAHSGLSLSALRPFQQMDLVRLAHSPTLVHASTDVYAAATDKVRDMLIMLDADICAHPYSAKSKNIDLSTALARRAKLGGPITEECVPEYTIHGDPVKARLGPSATGIAIARRWGLAIPKDTDKILRMADQIADGLSDPDLRTIYRDLHRLASRELSRRRTAIHKVGPASAKLLSGVLLTTGV